MPRRRPDRAVAPPAPPGLPATAAEIVELVAMPGLTSRYVRGVAGSVRAAASRHRTVAGRDLPSRTVVVRDIAPDADRLSDYQHLVGEAASDMLPAGFVHVLTFPIAMDLMVEPAFPLPLLGLVHVANRVTQHRGIRLGERLDVTVHAENLRAHRAGVTVDLVAEVTTTHVPHGREPVHVEPDVRWRGVSTYLAKGYRLADGATASDTSHQEWTAPVPTAQWRLEAGEGRRYAAVSGDRNPIHTSALAARALGFPRAIAHGMDTAARALAAVGAARGEAYTWEVDFAKPVLLPSTVSVRVAPDHGDEPTHDGSGRFAFAVWDPRTGRRHLTGSVTPLR